MSVAADQVDDPFGDLGTEPSNDISSPDTSGSSASTLPAAGDPSASGDATPKNAAAKDASAADAGVVAPRGAPVSAGKRPVIRPAPALPAWAATDDQDRGDGEVEQVDYHDLASINRDLLHLRARMHRVRRGMRQAARDAVEAKLTYHRALRRALVQQSGGSAETRKASAELLCEDLEADMVMKQQVVDEYNSLFRAVRDDVENAKTVAYNLRSLMSLGG